MNLVVVARQPEVGERSAETISRLTGRHPSRTLVVQGADPDGPPWIDARIQAHCVMPRADAPETCTELIFLTAGGETGRHLFGLVAPLLVHDLPVTVWWPGEPLLASQPVRDLLEATDILVVDGSAWSGDGVDRLVQLAGLYDAFERLAIRDFALVRQSRWREAIATVFDQPDFVPFLPVGAPDRRDLRDPRRDRRARHDQHRQAAVPRRVAGLAARPAGRGAAGGRARRRRARRPRRRGCARARSRRSIAGSRAGCATTAATCRSWSGR